MPNFRASSKTNYSSNDSIEHINAGSLQRIADAAEVMAKNYNMLLQTKENYKQWYEQRGQRIVKLERQNAALRGQITKLKKKLANSATFEVID